MIKEDWSKEWERKKETHKIKRKVRRWKIIKKVIRREEVVMNRLRSGYTQLTHGCILGLAWPHLYVLR